MTAPIPADAERAVAAFAGRVAELHAQTEAANAALARARGEGRSADGLVTVTVDASGAMADVRFGAVTGVDPETLRRAVLEAAAAARVAMLRAAREDVALAVGADSPAVLVLDGRIAEAAAAEPSTDSSPGPSGDPRPDPDGDEDDELPYDRRIR